MNNRIRRIPTLNGDSHHNGKASTNGHTNGHNGHSNGTIVLDLPGFEAPPARSTDSTPSRGKGKPRKPPAAKSRSKPAKPDRDDLAEAVEPKMQRAALALARGATMTEESPETPVRTDEGENSPLTTIGAILAEMKGPGLVCALWD